jgi:hypothetical protein
MEPSVPEGEIIKETLYYDHPGCDRYRDHGIPGYVIGKVAATRKTGGSRFGCKPLLLGQRLKALAFTSFKPLCYSLVAAPSRGIRITD